MIAVHVFRRRCVCVCVTRETFRRGPVSVCVGWSPPGEYSCGGRIWTEASLSVGRGQHTGGRASGGPRGDVATTRRVGNAIARVYSIHHSDGHSAQYNTNYPIFNF